MSVLTKENLEELYNKYNSIKKVAKVLRMPYSTVYYYFKEYKIGNYSNRGISLSKEELIKLHDKYGSITKVAAAISKSYATVRAWYSYYGIIYNTSSMNVFQEIRNTPMSLLHKSVVLGSVLGDGHLRKAPHSKNALLEISHCEKQSGYLAWKKSILSPFSRNIVLKEVANPNKYVCGQHVSASNFYRFNTIAHEDITKIYNEYYENGKKRVSANVIKDLDLLAMSIWFGDDGSVQRTNYGEPKNCSIATNSFTYKEHLLLVEAVRKFFGGTLRIHKVRRVYKGEEKIYFMLYMSGKEEVIKFLDTIKAVLPECIHFKLS